MQAKSHFHLIICSKTFGQSLIIAILEHSWILVNFDQSLDDREITHNTNILPPFPRNFITPIIDLVTIIRQRPNHKKSFTNILISTTTITIDRGMYKLTNFIHKEHNIFMEDFSNLGEISNITEPKNSTFFPAPDHRIHIPLLHDIRPYNFGPSGPKNKRQQSPNFNNSIMNNSSLVLCVVYKTHCDGLGIFCHLDHFLHHLLNWMDNQIIDIFREEM